MYICNIFNIVVLGLSYVAENKIFNYGAIIDTQKKIFDIMKFTPREKGRDLSPITKTPTTTANSKK